MRRWSYLARVVSILITLAVVAAACGDDGEAGDPQTPDTTTTADSEDPADPADPEETPELTASYTGVTPEVIKIGQISFDFDRLATAGIGTGQTNVDDVFAAPFEAINDAGGIHGRMIEITSIRVLPIGSAEQDEACIKLTEDDPVFLVTGSLRGATECYTELNSTAAVAVSGMTDERLAEAKAPYVTVAQSKTREAELAIAQLVEAGVFDGEVVGLTGSVDANEGGFLRVAELLDEYGIEYIDGLVGENNNDIVAGQSEGQIIGERFDSEGVTLILNTVGLAVGLENYASDPDPAKLVLLPIVGAQTMVASGIDLEPIDGAISFVEKHIGTSTQPDLANDPVAAACVENIEARTDHEISFELGVESNLNAAMNACAVAAIVEAALTAAGPDLTYDSFSAGLDSIGDIDLAGYISGNLGPGKRDASSSLTMVQFDAQLQAWVPVE